MSDFVQSQLNKARKDKFILIITIPEIFKNINTSNLGSRGKEIVNSNSMQFSIFGNVIPEIDVPPVTAGYAGQNFKVSSHSRIPHEDLDVDFTIDNRFNNYWFIYKWLDVLNDTSQSYYDASGLSKKIVPPAYQTTFTVFAKDEFDKDIMKFTYTNAFPIRLRGIKYSYRDAGEIESGFTFAFSQFKVEPM